MAISEVDKKHVESLFPALNKIKDFSIREKVITVWVEGLKDGNYDKIEDIAWMERQPWSNKYTWSLIDHTNQVTSCALAIAKFAKEVMAIEVNMDILIAGACLHDVDKTVLCDAKTKERTDWYKKLPHGTYSAHMALKYELPLDVAHILVSHTAFSAKRQQTVEALIVHMADYITADLRNLKEGVDFMFTAQAPHYFDGVIKLGT